MASNQNTSRVIVLLILIPASLLILFSFTRLVTSSEVPYPEGYRHWKHVKTGIVGKNSPGFNRIGGYHHIYANPAAERGYATGRFPNGSILVFDVLEALETNTNIAEGRRRVVDVMVKDTMLYSESGGWGFEEFKESSKTIRNVKALAIPQCFNCHASKKEEDYVFSKMRDE